MWALIACPHETQITIRDSNSKSARLELWFGAILLPFCCCYWDRYCSICVFLTCATKMTYLYDNSTDMSRVNSLPSILFDNRRFVSEITAVKYILIRILMSANCLQALFLLTAELWQNEKYCQGQKVWAEETKERINRIYWLVNIFCHICPFDNGRDRTIYFNLIAVRQDSKRKRVNFPVYPHLSVLCWK